MNIKILSVVAVALTAVTAYVLFANKASGYGVNDVSSDPDAFKGQITVVGVMAGLSQQDAAIFGIMDKKELKCATLNCNKIIIPIRYQGKMPVVGDEVAVTGVFSKEGGGFLFNASKVAVVKHHQIGG